MAFLDLLKTNFKSCTKDRMALCEVYISRSDCTITFLQDKVRQECSAYFQNLQGAPYCRICVGKNEFFYRILRVQEPTYQKKPLSFDYIPVNDGRCSLLLEDSNGVRFEAVTIQTEFHNGITHFWLMPSDALMDHMRRNLYENVDLSKSFLYITPLRTEQQVKACMEAAMERRMAAKARYENELAERARAAAEAAGGCAQQEETLNNSAEMNDLFRSMGQDWRK